MRIGRYGQEVSPLTGPLMAAALLLGVAGVAKIVSPDPTRVALRTAGLPGTVWFVRMIAVGEVILGVVAVVVGGRAGAALLGLAYLGFAGFSMRVISTSRGKASCGCFGASDAPLGTLHVVINLAIVGAAAITVIHPMASLATVLSDTPLGGSVFVAFVVLLAWLLHVALTGLPELQAAARPPRKVAR